jgi:hypothetical protein
MTRLERTFRPRVTSRNLLARVLDAPELARQVAGLDPTTLSRLIDRVGLEDAGEIVALASTSQLLGLFDEDLWSNERPGDEEYFDAARFVTWLEVLLEAGEAFAAEHIAELSLDFVTLAFSRLMLVLNVDGLFEEFDGGGDEVDRVEKALSNCLSEELDEFQLVARHADGWDALLALVLALDQEHRPFLRQVLERCCDLSSSYIEDNGGLYDVLRDPEMLESDAGAEREDRRAAQGYVAPSQAKSFLALCRTEAGEPRERDAVTRAYFRELAPSDTKRSWRSGSRDPRDTATERIERLLAAAELHEHTPRTLGLRPQAAAVERPLLTRALEALQSESPELGAARREELSYLANVLIAGSSLDGRRFRAVEALEAAIAVTNLGLELSVRDLVELDAARRALTQLSADLLFRRGFARLESDLTRPAREASLRSPLAEDVPRIPRGDALGFVSTLAELDVAKKQLRPLGRKRAQRSARVNGSSQ